MSTPPVREQFLLINALGGNAMELTCILSRACHENRCAITTSRLTRHNNTCSLTLEVAGNWDALARLEASLPVLSKRHGFTTNIARGSLEAQPSQALPYIAYVSASYRPDILNELCQFFSDHKIELENLTSDTFQAPHTGSTMFNATLTLSLPAGTQISWLRDQFLDFADSLNLDALLEPWRPQIT